MTCIKTGAQVYFSNYGMTLTADVYKVGNVTIIIGNTASNRYGPPGSLVDYFVDMVEDSSIWFNRSDLGITVVPNDYITIAQGNF